MSHYEGPQNNLHNPYRQQAIPMDDMPYKPGKSPEEIAEGAKREWEAELKKREAAEKRRATRAANAKKRPPTTRQTTTRATKKQTGRVGSRPVKKLPAYRLPGEQPRDSLGRFASYGAAVWRGTKAVARGTRRAVKATAKTVKSTHRAIKQSNATARRRANLEHRERALALRERAAKLKGKSRRKSGKGKAVQRKQGFLSRLFGGGKKVR